MGLVMALFGAAHPTRRGGIWRLLTVVLGESSVLLPDLVYVSRERRQIVSDIGIRGAPDLIAEIVSPGSATIDRVLKRNLYATYGVKYYWIIEPLAEWIRAYELGADGLYELVAEAHGNETFSAPPFADLQISLADLWADPMAGN